MMYGESGFDAEDVYGVPLAGEQAEEGKKFMHGQVAWCGCTTKFSIISLLFTLAAMNKYTELVSLFPNLPQEEADKMKMFVQGDYADKMKGQAIGGLISCLIFGTCVILVSREFIKQESCGGKIKACCILNYCCACGYCLQGLAYCGGTFFFFSIVAITKYPTKVCQTVKAELVAGIVGVTQTTTIAPVTTPAPGALASTTLPLTEGSCITAVGVLKDLATLYGIFMIIAMIFAYCLSCICSASAKAAKNLDEEFEKAESGYGGGGYY